MIESFPQLNKPLNTEPEKYNESQSTPWKRDLTLKENFTSKEKIYGETYEKEISVFTDELNKNWYELQKQPQMQMFTSLVSSTFCNISPVIKEEMYTKIAKKINKINELIPFLKLSEKYQDRDWYKKEVYLSAGVNVDNVSPKSFTEANLEKDFLRVVFNDNDHELGFDWAYPKRNFSSISKNNELYYTFFDFDQASIDINDLDQYKESCLSEINISLKYYNNDADSLNGYLDLAKEKIKNWKFFISSEDGKEFILAAYKKSNLDKFYQNRTVDLVEEKEYIQQGASKIEKEAIESTYKEKITQTLLNEEQVYSILKDRIKIFEEIILEISNKKLDK